MVDRHQHKKNKSNRYIPDPFEAAALKQLNSHWRFFASKEDFEQTIADLKKKTLEASGQTVTAYDAARANTVISLGAQLYDYNPESILAAEEALKADKTSWNKIQAAHLYNSAGFKPEIENPLEFEDAQAIFSMIEKQLETMEKGNFTDGQYVPSKAEKNVLRTLSNYGCFVRNPKTAEDTEQYFDRMKKSFQHIMKRNDYRIDNPRVEQPRRNKKMTDETIPFVLTDEQRKISEELGIGTDFDSLEAYEEAVSRASAREGAGEEKNGTENPREERPEENAGEEKTAEENTEEATADKPLSVTVEEQQPAENTQEMPEWVKHKAQFYESLAQQGQIQGYEHDTTKEGFAAKLEGAHIHYSSPDNVSVSPEAGFKVFDAMFKEPDNKGRPIEFPENASKEIATRMFAACVLNGNPMQGAVPTELDEQALAECGLSAEDLAKVQEALAQRQPQQQANEEQNQETQESPEPSNQENPSPENGENTQDVQLQQMQDDLNKAALLGIAPEQATIAYPDRPMAVVKPDAEIQPLQGQEREDFISSLPPEELKRISRQFANTPAVSEEQKAAREDILNRVVQNDVKQLEEIRHSFNQMKEDGLIAVGKDEQGKPKIIAGANGNEANVKAAESIMKEAAALVREGLEANAGSRRESTMTRSDGTIVKITSAKLDTQAKQDNNTAYREQQVAFMRSVMNRDKGR